MINTYITLNREAEIIDELIAIAEKFNTEPVYYFILGTIYGNSESELFNIDEAVSYYTKAIQIDPNYEKSLQVLYSLGLISSKNQEKISESIFNFLNRHPKYREFIDVDTKFSSFNTCSLDQSRFLQDFTTLEIPLCAAVSISFSKITSKIS